MDVAGRTVVLSYSVENTEFQASLAVSRVYSLQRTGGYFEGVP